MKLVVIGGRNKSRSARRQNKLYFLSSSCGVGNELCSLDALPAFIGIYKGVTRTGQTPSLLVC